MCVVVLQLASLAWDERARKLVAEGSSLKPRGAFFLEQCAFNPAYFQLAAMYPKEYSFVGKGSQDQVTM